MTPATYNLLEAIVRATVTIAEAALPPEEASRLRKDIHSRLVSAKIAMQRDANEDVVEDMAAVVVALSKFVLGLKPTAPGKIEKKQLQEALRNLEKRHEDRRQGTEATLHPTGRCTCAGEGSCEWCKTHCVHCGAEAEQHGPGSTHYFEPHGEGHEPDPEVTDEWAENAAQAPEMELQHGGELREREPVIEDKTNEDIGLDRRWRLITDVSGYPVAALFRNGSKDSLSEEQYEQLRAVILPVVAGWGK